MSADETELRRLLAQVQYLGGLLKETIAEGERLGQLADPDEADVERYCQRVDDVKRRLGDARAAFEAARAQS